MDSLNEQARSALREYKAAISPSARQGADGWAAVVERMDGAPPPAARTSSSWKVAIASLSSLAAAWAVVCSVSSPDQPQRVPEPMTAQLSLDQSETRTRSGAVRVRAAARRALQPRARPMTVEEPPRPAPEDPPRRRGGARGKAPGAAPPATPPSPEPRDPLAELQAERLLLERARAALVQGRPEETVRLVRRHTTLFSQATMREEMALLEVHALCALGAVDQWREKRARFLAEHEDSPLRAHLTDTCPR